MGRSYNELALLQLQRQYERQEDKARLRVQQGLLPGPDSQRQRGFPKTEQTQFRPETGHVGRELSRPARPGGLGAAVLASLLQRYHSSVSTQQTISALVFARAFRSVMKIFVCKPRFPLINRKLAIYTYTYIYTQKKIECQIKTYILNVTRSLFRIYATIYNLLIRI